MRFGPTNRALPAPRAAHKLLGFPFAACEVVDATQSYYYYSLQNRMSGSEPQLPVQKNSQWKKQHKESILGQKNSSIGVSRIRIFLEEYE